MDDDDGKRPGAVFRTTPKLETERMLDGIHIPNTVSFSPDGKTLYMADSRLQTHLRPRDGGPLEGPAMFAHTAGEPGSPDGSAVDAHGYLWNAQWGGWRIVRYSPKGEIDTIIPHARAAALQLRLRRRGHDHPLRHQRLGRAAARPPARQQPLAGGLFAIETGVKGLALPLFEG